jgi:uncharacterized protein YciI
MKSIATLLLVAFLALNGNAQTSNVNYDHDLAEKLGADEYGMKQYILVILKTGSNVTADKETVNRLFAGHMENITRLVKEHKLVVAGPMGKNVQDYRGIFILDVKTIAEAQALLTTDPAVKEKLLEAELYNWYGSAALPAYLETHQKIEKKKH